MKRLHGWRLGIGLLGLGLISGAYADALQTTDAMMAEKLGYDKAGTELKAHWQQEQQSLSRLLNNYRVERQLLQQRLQSANAEEDEAGARREALASEQLLLEQEAGQYSELVDTAAQRLSAIWSRLPAPVVREQQDELNLLLNSQEKLASRFTALVNLIEALVSFDQSISLDRTLLVLEEQQWQAQVLYLGLGRALYRLPDGSRTGVGFADDSGWKWQTVAAEDHDAINNAFAIYLQQQSAALVSLPLLTGEQGGDGQ